MFSHRTCRLRAFIAIRRELTTPKTIINMSKFYITCCNVLLMLIISVSTAFAQQTVTGRVTDANGPMPGVTVSVTGTDRQAQTDANGNYSIQAANGSVLIFSRLGYSSRDVMVTSNKQDVLLSQGASDVGEVVVTALGIKRERKSLAYAVQEIKGSELLETREANLANALSGKVAGLQVARSSNGAGGSAKIVLRGFSSVTNDNQPLIVVDGIPMNNFTGTTENGYFGAGLDRGNGLGDISSDDIETMTVLKGASAAALYGTRAGNGVILITTKSGRSKAGLGITASSNMGVETIFMQPKFQNSFAQGDAGAFDPTSPSSWGPRIDGQTVTKWNGQEEVLTARDNLKSYLQNGTTQNHNVAFQQQYGNTSVYTAINRLDNRSILPTNRFTRTNLTTRMGSKFGAEERWSTDVKVQYSNTKGVNRPINGRDWSSIYALQMLPRTLDILDFKDNTVNEFGEMIWYRGGAATFNPYWRLENDRNEDQRDRFLLNGSLGYQFTDWLKGEFKAGADLYTNNLESRVRAGGPSSRNGSFSTGKDTFRETNYQGLLIAQKDNIFGKFGGSATLGGNLMHQTSNGLNVNVGQLQIPNLFTPGNSVGAASVLPFNSERKINSVFGALSVNYDAFIFLESTLRNDWTSTLSRANRSFFYPSFNLSYVVSEHIEKAGGTLPSWLSFTKLRASYADAGNDMAPYQLYNVYSIGGDPNGNVTANTGVTAYDATVRSELIRNIEFGAEMRLFNNKLSLDFSWYKSNAFNQLMNLDLDPASGFANRKINGGDIQNKGWELMANANIIERESSFRWDATLNLSRNINSVNDIAARLDVNTYPIGGFDDLAFIARGGGKYGEIWGHRYNRVADQSSPYFGQLILNNQGLPTRSATPEYLGEQQANEMASLINNFSYKNFGLSFQVDARFGGLMYVGTHRGMQSVGTADVTAPGGLREEFVVDGVVGSNGNYTKNEISVTPQQYYTAIATANNLGVNEEYLRDATNIRLRNIQVNYSFPRKMLGSSVFQSARVFASCNNVWMIHSKMDGIDPESTFATGSNAIGFENGAPPTMRSFIFGFSLGF